MSKKIQEKTSEKNNIQSRINDLVHNLRVDVKDVGYFGVLSACDPIGAFQLAHEDFKSELECAQHIIIELKAHLAIAEEYLRTIKG